MPPRAAAPRAWPLTGAVRANLAELIVPLARAGRDDPAIAAALSITPTQVRGLRAQFHIPGHQRDENQT